MKKAAKFLAMAVLLGIVVNPWFWFALIIHLNCGGLPLGYIC